MDAIAGYGSSDDDDDDDDDQSKIRNDHDTGKFKTESTTSASAAAACTFNLLPGPSSDGGAEQTGRSCSSIFWSSIGITTATDGDHNRTYLDLLHERVIQKNQQQQDESTSMTRRAQLQQAKLMLGQRWQTPPVLPSSGKSSSEMKGPLSKTTTSCLAQELDADSKQEFRNPRFMELAMQQMDIPESEGLNSNIGALQQQDAGLMKWEFNLIQLEEEARIRQSQEHQQQREAQGHASQSYNSAFAQDQ
ncbi:hypothetical protein ACA910_017586 [Epithemia clementina (nom. ined.)]